MSGQQQQKLKWPERICEDFNKSNGEIWKGCGQVIIMQKTGKMKDDGKPEWKKFNKDGSPHTHDPTKQGTTRLDDVRGPVSNPNPIVTSNVLEQQVAVLAQEVEGIKLRLKDLEEKQIKSDADAMVNASDDELGEDSDE